MMEEEMKLISEKINKQEGRKYPCSNQIVVCGFFSTDEDWNNFVNNNLDKIKIRQKIELYLRIKKMVLFRLY